jgi:hypothetical protein
MPAPKGPKPTAVPDPSPPPVAPVPEPEQPKPKEKCPKCKDEHPDIKLCDDLPGTYIYSSKKLAVAGWGRVKFEKEETTTSGPCVGQGLHVKVRLLDSNIVNTITSCPCCVDTGGGPVLQERWRRSE